MNKEKKVISDDDLMQEVMSLNGVVAIGHDDINYVVYVLDKTVVSSINDFFNKKEINNYRVEISGKIVSA
jgi:hypothetical protein